jgi:hypothetical protein
MRMKVTISLREGTRSTAPSDSLTPTRRPPTTAPSKLPIPPITTMLNEVTVKKSPELGVKGKNGVMRLPATPTHAAPMPKARAKTLRMSVPTSMAPT